MDPMKTSFDLIAEDVVSSVVEGAGSPEGSEPSPPPGGLPDRMGQKWAEDIFWVYDHLGEKLSRAKAGSSGRYELWKWAKKNTDHFMGQLFPKAMLIDEKARDKAGDTGLVELEEKKSIAEIERILRAAVLEATQIQ